MDRRNERRQGFFENVKTAFGKEALRRGENGKLLLADALIFTLAFVFARCHLVFGAYPLAVAFVSTLKSGVFIAVLGAVCGAFSLGRIGIIYAVITLVTLFLRIIVSGGAKGEKRLFCESLPLKIASAGISALVGGMYQIVLDGFSAKSLLFALFGISLSCGFTFLFSGIYLANISVSDVLFSKKTIFNRKNFDSDKEKFDLFFYAASLLTFVYVVGVALSGYTFLGISLTYVYSGFLTLFTAKRFGSLKAMIVGFLSSFSMSGIYAVSYAFAGLGAGLFFSFGTYYAIIFALTLLSVYSYYVGNLDGVISTFPEFIVASILFLPCIRYLSREREDASIFKESKIAERMVNTASLSYKNKGIKACESTALSSISSLSKVISAGAKNEGEVEYAAYRDAVLYAVREYCLSCPSFDICSAESPAPCAENIDLIAQKLSKKNRLFTEDIDLFPKYCAHKNALHDKVIRAAFELENNAKKNCRMANRSKDYELLARALDESFKAGDERLSVNIKQSEELEKVMAELGFGDASAKVFGTKKRHIITAGLDAGGKISTSKELRDAIEKKLSAKISAGDFYKKDDFILSEFDELEKFECTLGTSSEIKTGERIGGDSTVSFKDSEGKFYVLLCDGEGSGEEAKEVSILTCDYLSRILKSSVSKATAISAINHILKNRDNEKGVTVDLFELDLYTGEGVFYKCGAVSSYIKRSDSIFKVRSQSAPIGLMSSIDAESIRVDVRAGDTVVLVSDGVLSENEDSTWFLEILNREKVGDVKEYADMILNHAKKRNDCADDMSVAVIKISA